MTAPEAEIAALLGDLVAIPSVNPAFRQEGDHDEWFGEAAMAAHVSDWLRQLGLDVEFDAVFPGRANVIARLRGRPGGRRLLWEGHLDTVQASGMTIDPFKPEVREGRLYGRGAVDDKGCVTAFMLALKDLAARPPDCDVTFVAAVDEEYQFKGIQHHMARGERYDFGVAGEPTELRIVRACKGCVRWEIIVTGKAAHTSKPVEGIDALLIAEELLQRLRASDLVGSASHPLLGRSTLTCTRFEAGEGPNTVPAAARLRFDYRLLPGQKGADIWNEVGRIAARFAETMPPPARIAVLPPFIDALAMDVPEDSQIVAAMQDVCRSLGVSAESIGVPFGSDASTMSASGVPTIVFGPGSIAQAHTADEFVEIAQVAKAADMLAALARAF